MIVVTTFTFVVLVSTCQAIPTESSELQVTNANGQFANDLYKSALQENSNGAFSPISVHMSLSVLYQGTGGSTKQTFANVLKVSDPSVAAEGYYKIIDKLNTQKTDIDERFYKDYKVNVTIANKAYVSQGIQLKPAFKETIENKFGSEVEAIDFSNSKAAADTINNWVKEKTKEKISEIVDKDTVEDAAAVLVNAIYFKALWLKQFYPESTKNKPFFLEEGKTIDVQMMYRKSKYFYKEDEALDAKILHLLYNNENYRMLIILPNEKNGLKNLEEKLLSKNINEVVSGASYRDIKVTLPKFKIEFSISLNEALTKMGLGEIFQAPDLSGISENRPPLKISKVLHKVFIQVDEYGSEAAAATAVNAVPMSGLINPPPPIEFTADHPFVFLLTFTDDEVSGGASNVLFYGKVVKPEF